jgi:hypothetical protein
VVLFRVPQAALVQPAPERLQVTAWLAAAGLTVAVNCCVPVIWSVATVGETETPVGAGMSVIVAEADLLLSAAEVALRVSVAGLGTFAGAV